MLQTFTALAEPNRLAIIELLRAGPQPVGELVRQTRLPQPSVSKHLRVLRDAGLVEVHPRGNERLYGLRAAALQALHDWLEGYRQLWDARFQGLDQVLVELQSPVSQREKS